MRAMLYFHDNDKEAASKAFEKVFEQINSLRIELFVGYDGRGKRGLESCG